jgi:hypothetical protein
MPVPIVLSNPLAAPSTVPPADEDGPAYLEFYLLTEQLDWRFFQDMVAFPFPVSYLGSQGLILVAALTTNTQDAAIKDAQPQPAGFDGTVESAKKVMRANTLTHFWWLFDWFVGRVKRPVRPPPTTEIGDPAPFEPAVYENLNYIYLRNTNTLATADTFEITLGVTPVEHGLDLLYTLRYLGAASSQAWPEWRMPMPDLGYTGFWHGGHKWKRTALPDPWNASQYDPVYGGNICAFNCMSFDNLGGGAPTPWVVGISTEHPYLHAYSYAWYYGRNVIVCGPNYWSYGYTRILPDEFRPGETKTILYHLRAVPATGEAASVLSQQPYIDFMRATCPAVHPPKINGRIAGTLLTVSPGAGQEFRRYNSYGGLRVDEFSGWYDLLHAVCDQNWGGAANLIANSYKAIMLWTVTGFADNGNDFIQDIWGNLPPNLASTKAEIDTWEAETGLKVFLWCGRSWGSYQAGDYLSAGQSSLATGEYNYVDGLPLDWTTWSIKPAALAEWTENYYGAAQYVSGLGFDAFPLSPNDPWIAPALAAWTSAFPNAWRCSEREGLDRSWQYAVPFYDMINATFEGRCPLADAIYPGMEFCCQTAGGYQVAESLFVESQGGVIVGVGSILTEPYNP